MSMPRPPAPPGASTTPGHPRRPAAGEQSSRRPGVRAASPPGPAGNSNTPATRAAARSALAGRSGQQHVEDHDLLSRTIFGVHRYHSPLRPVEEISAGIAARHHPGLGHDDRRRLRALVSPAGDTRRCVGQPTSKTALKFKDSQESGWRSRRLYLARRHFHRVFGCNFHVRNFSV